VAHGLPSATVDPYMPANRALQFGG